MISEEAVAEFLRSNNIKEYSRKKLLSKGVNSTIFLIITESERYVLNVFSSPLDQTTLSLIMKGSAFFAQMGFPFPKVLASGKVDGYDALLTSFQTGKVITTWGAKEYEKVGLLLGSLHLAGSEFVIEESKPPLILSLQYDFKEIVPHIPSSFRSIEASLDHLQSVWPAKLPSGLIHNDIWYKNILFNDNKIAAVLDFTMPACDLFVLDLATLIKGIYFSSHSPSPNDDLNCFLTYYQKARPLSHEELDSLETMIQCKILYTIIYMLKKSIERPAQKENFLNLASFNLLKLEDSKHISFAKILT